MKDISAIIIFVLICGGLCSANFSLANGGITKNENLYSQIDLSIFNASLSTDWHNILNTVKGGTVGQPLDLITFFKLNNLNRADIGSAGRAVTILLVQVAIVVTNIAAGILKVFLGFLVKG